MQRRELLKLGAISSIGLLANPNCVLSCEPGDEPAPWLKLAVQQYSFNKQP